MKFGIRFADQIVGLVIILALASLAIVIVMMGQAQRWVAEGVDFYTLLSSAGGLSKNMAIQYKGFTIGNVKDFQLNDDDNVKVIFTIHEDYTRLARQGSIVELQVGIISLLGSQFVFHPGRDDQQALAKDDFIPIKGSAQANEYVRQRIATISESEDSIAIIMNQVTSLLAGVTNLIDDLNVNLDPDEAHSTEVGLLLGGINKTLASVDNIPEILDSTIDGVLGTVLTELGPLLNRVDDLLAGLNEPGGVISLLDSDDGGLKKTIDSLPGTIDGLNNTIASTVVPLQSQLPVLLTQLRTVLRSVDDVLVGLANNPLLKGGVPERPVTQTTGPRDINFF
jgi:phospholipid/cholesterol/gamma-HCH transport system substrate-binding protein